MPRLRPPLPRLAVLALLAALSVAATPVPRKPAVARRPPAAAPAPASAPGGLARVQAALQKAKDARIAEESGAYALAVTSLRAARVALEPDADLELELALDEARCGRLDSAAALLRTPLMDRALADSLPVTRRHFQPWEREKLWTNGRFDSWHWYVARARFEVAFAQRRWPEARRAAEACVTARPLAGMEWLALALAAGHGGDDATAATAAGLAAALDPLLPESQYLAGLYAWRAGRRADAQGYFQQAIALDSMATLPAVALMRSRLPGSAPAALPEEFLTGVRAAAMLTSPERPKLEEFQQFETPARLARPGRVPIDSTWAIRLKQFEMVLPVLIDERGRAVACAFPWVPPSALPAPAVAAMIGSLPDWQFVPAMRSGVPQRSWVSVPYRLQ